MSSRKTYKWSEETQGLKPHKYGEYDGDGDKITTYRRNSQGKLELDINGRLDKKGNEVTTYKECKAEKYYRRHVGGRYTQEQVDKFRREVKPVSASSTLTAAIEEQKKRAQGEQDRADRAGAALSRQRHGEPSRSSTRGGSGEQRRATSRDRTRRGSPSGRALTREEIEQQDLEDARATALYHEDGPQSERNHVSAQDPRGMPPKYEDHRNDYIDRRLVGTPTEVHDRNAPPYASKTPPFPESTGQTHRLGKRIPRDTRPETTFGDRYDPNAPNSYSSGGRKHGNRPLTSSDEEPRRTTSGSEGVFGMSDLENGLSSSGEKNPMSPPQNKASQRKSADMASERGGSLTKMKEPAPRRKEQAPISGSLGDSESSPRERGFRRDARHGSSSKDQGRGSSKERRGEKVARNASQDRKARPRNPRKDVSDHDSLYGMS